jgi:TatD DNase family protein
MRKKHMKLIDTHCHIDLDQHFPDYEEVLQRAKTAGVSDIVLAGVTRSGWLRMFELSRKYPGVHAAPGLHPMYLDCHQHGDLELLELLAGTHKLVAIGEVGLDYHVQNLDREKQQNLFETQIDIATRTGLPLLLHVRKAHDQVLATLRRKRFQNGGIAHAFNGSFQQATHFIKLGFMIGVCGTVTYDRSRKIRRVAAELPLESLVLETDAPDIPPALHWGERNVPEYLNEVLDSLTLIRSESREQIAEQTTRNCRKVLHL